MIKEKNNDEDRKQSQPISKSSKENDNRNKQLWHSPENRFVTPETHGSLWWDW